MHPVAIYLDRLHEIQRGRRGVPELSYRAALENLLNAIGDELDPVVRATHELADTGAGRPDFGLFETKSGNARGVVEVKAVEEDTPQTADGTQVAKYWKHYGCILVTNYRDFLIVVRQADGKPRVEGRYRFSADAETFWRARPAALAKEHAEALTDFLVGYLTRLTPIARPKDLANDLARHAREARRRLAHHDSSALAPLQNAMEQALGLHFEGSDGQAFFQSSLVQTLFYGLFSGWMLWRQGKHKPGTFYWKDASDHLALPLIGDLYDEISKPKRLADLGLREPLEWATASLGRVDEQEFFQRFDADHAITLFYEPFLQAFDPVLRKELGVWYTPPEIVQYMVGRVDQLLRSELGIADGLADEQVYVLDPAAGTGSYLVEVARRIHATLTEQGHGALAAARVKKALCSRIFGFEILPAPYVVAHLQLGVLLRSLGTRLVKDERCEVYLTNALTGWEPPKEPKSHFLFPELFEEAERASRVKREAPILVILGNPPYNGFAGVALEEEADLIKPYKDGLYEKWGVSKQLLDDLYVRFFRLAERRIGEGSQRGLVCYISNYSWLDGLSHPNMRERLMTEFDQLWIDNCNGDKYRTGKRTPDGKPDQSMFTTEEQAIGIQVGTAITTLVKRGKAPKAPPIPEIYFRELWGFSKAKRAELMRSLAVKNVATLYARTTSSPRQRYAIYMSGGQEDYQSWPKLPEILPDYVSGIVSRRDEFVIDIDRETLAKRLKRYFDASVPDSDIVQDYPRAMEDGSGFVALEARRKLLKTGFDARRIVSLYYRPFDVRWIYYEPGEGLVNAASPRFNQYLPSMKLAIEMRQKIPTLQWDRGFVVNTLGDSFGNGCSVYFTDTIVHSDPLHGSHVDPNIVPELLGKICEAQKIKTFEKDGHTYTAAAMQSAEHFFYHILAILWSPAYRRENEATLRQDWPRIPIPAEPSVLDPSAQLGRRVADLLLPDKPVLGVTTGRLRLELRSLGVPSKIGGGEIDPSTDLKVTAGWGFRGQKNAVMCGKGKGRQHAGDPDKAVDIFINDAVYWANVPSDVWTMTIGGYPVIKKWLSYREFKVLGRPLRLEEMTYITEVIRRLKALLLLGGELDANYRAAAAKTLSLARPESGAV